MRIGAGLARNDKELFYVNLETHGAWDKKFAQEIMGSAPNSGISVIEGEQDWESLEDRSDCDPAVEALGN